MDVMEETSHDTARARITYVSDEAARLLLLEELADPGPGFALQVAEEWSGALVHSMHVPLLQLAGFLVHVGEDTTHLGKKTGQRKQQGQPRAGAYKRQSRVGLTCSKSYKEAFTTCSPLRPQDQPVYNQCL